ncbi:GNAT family N-acetyltransferase [Actibacterium sp. MT2.3-13A]|uniref:GNAT family N-acetyltransferase n=1 Tax=Actibacterium sp. MT2.3-13A TaxID=2828332 RepID=UPI001BAB46AB|nr:GNAT family N-acetyltransferase [Actibacterium sp. MT2.3-13A]
MSDRRATEPPLHQAPRRAPAVRLRPARPGDGPALAALLFEAVHAGAARHYSAEERRAWAPTPQPPAGWEPRLLEALTTVAVIGRRPAGFTSLGEDGFLDLLYVAPRWMGRGVADRLHAALIETARRRAMPVLSTEASHLARSFLSRRGWRTTARQSVIRDGVALTNFRMERTLSDG